GVTVTIMTVGRVGNDVAGALVGTIVGATVGATVGGAGVGGSAANTVRAAGGYPLQGGRVAGSHARGFRGRMSRRAWLVWSRPSGETSASLATVPLTG